MLGKWPEIPYKSVWSIAIFDIAWRKRDVNIHELQVSPMSRKYLLFRGT